jgi:hypothetical protein
MPTLGLREASLALAATLWRELSCERRMSGCEWV